MFEAAFYKGVMDNAALSCNLLAKEAHLDLRKCELDEREAKLNKREFDLTAREASRRMDKDSFARHPAEIPPAVAPRHFNGLTPGEAERLACMSEELGEIQQVIGKILRHGYESRDPTLVNAPTNRALLQTELGDFIATGNLMEKHGDIDGINVFNAARRKLIRIKQWLHHQ